MAQRVGCKGQGVQGDAMSLPFSDGSFDAVVGKSFVHHISDLKALLSEAWRVTKPGGWVVFFSEPTDPGSEWFRNYKRAYGKLIHLAVRGESPTL